MSHVPFSFVPHVLKRNGKLPNANFPMQTSQSNFPKLETLVLKKAGFFLLLLGIFPLSQTSLSFSRQKEESCPFFLLC